MLKDKKSKKIHEIYDILFDIYGNCDCPLTHKNPFELLVAVILSAQCTDIRVNIVTPKLFQTYPTPLDLANANPQELAEIIHSVGLYQSKAKNLINMAKKLVTLFNSQVPQSIEELIMLDGVGRKTANAVLSNAFNIPGFPVDTHVQRLLKILKIDASYNPIKIEKTVNLRLEPEKWGNFSHLLIFHGRAICKARNPKCEQCLLKNLCNRPDCPKSTK